MSEFNVGDAVYRYPGGFGRDALPKLVKVARVTQTTVLTDDGGRWNVRGWEWGSGQNSAWRQPAHIAHADEREQARVAEKAAALVKRRADAIQAISEYINNRAADLSTLENWARQIPRKP